MKKIGIRKSGGRNNQGRITVRSIGGGFKRLYRELEYRDGNHIQERSGKISAIEFDPNRSAYIAACKGFGQTYYKLVGGISMPKVGDMLNVVNIGSAPVGSSVYNVSLRTGKSGQLARARGASCVVVKQEVETGTTVVRLPSSAIKRLNSKNTCSIGTVFGEAITKLGTAGAHRRLGVRPKVRGVAMNPIDHPNGGKSHTNKIKNL